MTPGRLLSVRQAVALMPHSILVRPQTRTHSISRFAVRNKLSNFWVPTGGITEAAGDTSGHVQLLKAGFLRQSNVGMFHMLPLGLRVQKKIEALLDYYMQSVGGTRLGMSAISSKDLWVKSGRYEAMAPEVLQLQDRKGAPYLLGPTHEEEITNLVAKNVNSYKDLPLRLYQITNKYRDELRPRNGLLRGREFVMKDMYSFDIDTASALKTYEEVRAAYIAFFSHLKLPFLVADASTGDMGGSLSHEFHVASTLGEDTVVQCSACEYTANDELAETRLPALQDVVSYDPAQVRVWHGISKDRKTLVNAWYLQPEGADAAVSVNLHAVKALVPGLDTGIENAVPFWTQALTADSTEPLTIINIADFRLGTSFAAPANPLPPNLAPSVPYTTTAIPSTTAPNLLRIHSGDACPRCPSGILRLHKTLELGHTFHLGTRYSEPLNARVNLPASLSPTGAAAFHVPLQMGCFGIGVTRIIGAVAETMTDARGLRWPAAIAPFEVAVVADKTLVAEGIDVYDALARAPGEARPPLDVVLDDRAVSIPWKLKDADLVGYPVLVVLGKAFRERGQCEIQCRTLGVKEDINVDKVYEYVLGLLEKL
ncbi:hypothetical protein TD95_001903 [Thielaviopsis punctulata]|uniref:proline--tRNA ligase n=1 Tax=Thielaviopsis punctulata TaxID=72032 RepID=A0A0F4ZJD0_9PEZI|nr:hypothetical protein TD95_001903 [Thielaviopsis punctulata]